MINFLINKVWAQDVQEEVETAIETGVGGILPGFDINNIFGWAIAIGALVALGVIVFGGIRYASSGGNESQVDDAKKWIWAAVYGLLLLIGAWLILNTINPEILGG